MGTIDSTRTSADDPASPANHLDLLDYLADMTAELRDLAQQANCTTLAGILEVAEKEAQQQSRTAMDRRLNRRSS